MNGGKRFSTTYLHIGLGKTGSTAIQADLLRHARQLERGHDLLYPRSFPHYRHFGGNHSFLLRAMFARSQPGRERLAAMGLGSDTQLQKFNQRSLACFQRSFAASPAQRLLLSAEGVGHFSDADLQALAEWLGEISAEVKVIACLRHPLAALSSSIQQVLTVGGVLEELYEKPPIYAFQALFQRLEKVFPRENILVYDFARATAAAEPLATVLLEQIGIDYRGQIERRPPDNTSMSHAAALLLSALNRQRPVLQNGQRNTRHSPNAAKRLMQVPGRSFSAPAAVYERVRQQSAAELLWLRENYGLDLETPPAGGAQDDYLRFEQESIDALALGMAELARLEYELLSPLRKQLARLRILLGRIF